MANLRNIGTTSRVARASQLIRKGWVPERMFKKSHEKILAPFAGNTFESVIYTKTELAKGSNGHLIVFDWNGYITGQPIRGRRTATGKGETKRKFSDTLTDDRFRFVVDNGDRFDAAEINAQNLAEHENSVDLLTDRYNRFDDQSMIDTLQGSITGSEPTHRIVVDGASLSYNTLATINNILETSRYNGDSSLVANSSWTTRNPLKPAKMMDGKPCFYMFIDSDVQTILLQDSKMQEIFSRAMPRSPSNPLFNYELGMVGSLMIVKLPTFYGWTDSTAGTFEIEDSEVEMAGLRQVAITGTGANATQAWSGQSDYNEGLTNTSVYTRCPIVGAGALQKGMGKEPEYMVQESPDFGITTESALEVWVGYKKTKMKAEHSDYRQAKVASVDFGVIALDVLVR